MEWIFEYEGDYYGECCVYSRDMAVITERGFARPADGVTMKSMSNSERYGHSCGDCGEPLFDHTGGR